MKVAFSGVSHWHSLYYVKAMKGLPVDIVGVQDPDEAAARPWAELVDAPAFSSLDELCATTRPDLVVVLGRVSDMARNAAYLLAAGIPIIIEKPTGLNVSQISGIASLARDKGVFTGVPFAFRYSPFVQAIRELAPGGDIDYGAFRFFGGGTSRYFEWKAEWNLAPETAGGGCTLNLGIHFFDLINYLAPAAGWRVTGASMSNRLAGFGVEDYSSVVLEGEGGRRASVESGYVLPAPTMGTGPNRPSTAGDVGLSVAAGGHYFRLLYPNQLIVTTPDGSSTTSESPISQSVWYPTFIADCIERLRDGRPSPASLDDMERAARLAAQAYRFTSFDRCMAES